MLLLDDVMLELDIAKKAKFLELLPDYEQAFFTFLPDEPYLTYKSTETLCYTVKAGELESAPQ